MFSTKMWMGKNIEKVTKMMVDSCCPSSVGLEDNDEICNKVKDDCKKCWEDATKIKDIKEDK